jgi:hypothetical protein
MIAAAAVARGRRIQEDNRRPEEKYGNSVYQQARKEL